jgi:hypothetical protein
MPLTIADLDRAANDDRWLGFGYLGERVNVRTSTDPEAPANPVLVEATDQRVIDHANAQGWTYEDLFSWANSTSGRHFGDAMFGSDERFDARFNRAVGWGLLAKVAE